MIYPRLEDADLGPKFYTIPYLYTLGVDCSSSRINNTSFRYRGNRENRLETERENEGCEEKEGIKDMIDMII